MIKVENDIGQTLSLSRPPRITHLHRVPTQFPSI